MTRLSNWWNFHNSRLTELSQIKKHLQSTDSYSQYEVLHITREEQAELERNPDLKNQLVNYMKNLMIKHPEIIEFVCTRIGGSTYLRLIRRNKEILERLW